MNNPNNETYKSLNLDKITIKFSNKELCIQLLCDVGFHKSIDNKRLILDPINDHSKLKELLHDLTSSPPEQPHNDTFLAISELQKDHENYKRSNGNKIKPS